MPVVNCSLPGAVAPHAQGPPPPPGIVVVVAPGVVVVVAPGMVVVVLAPGVVVVVATHGSGEQVPGPMSSPFRCAQSCDEVTTQVLAGGGGGVFSVTPVSIFSVTPVMAPLAEERTQHCVSPGGPAMVVVVVLLMVVVVTLVHGFGSHDPGPWFVPPAASHASALIT
jgi:hypothetical protein